MSIMLESSDAELSDRAKLCTQSPVLQNNSEIYSIHRTEMYSKCNCHAPLFLAQAVDQINLSMGFREEVCFNRQC